MKSFREYLNEFRDGESLPQLQPEAPMDTGEDDPKPYIPPGWPGPRPESVKVWEAGYGEDAAFWADLDGDGDPDTEIFWDEAGGYWYYIDESGNHVQVP